MTRNRSTVPALDRAIDIIELMASSSHPLSFSEILSSLDIPRPSLARILHTLRVRGLIEKVEETGRYRLGMKFLYLGHGLKDKIRLRSMAFPFMQELSDLVQETVELSIFDHDQLVLIEQIEGTDEVRLYSRIGAAYPYLHAVAAGKIYLAHMEPEKRSRVLEKIGLPAVTDRTITSMERLERELSEVIEKGYATEDQELRREVCRIVAPIYEHNGLIAGCLGIAAPAFRLARQDWDRIGRCVKEIAQRVTSRLAGEI